MRWFVYKCAPIDFKWRFLPTVKDVAAQMAMVEAGSIIELGQAHTEGSFGASGFIALWDSAREAALAKGWQGDHQSPPCVLWIPMPNDGDFDVGFVIKQSSNHSTFVVSPVPMPHLNV